tara:strand:+ start:344 stop:1156 length:813 start_codon:yes stop_codon:yes gene_type:complete
MLKFAQLTWNAFLNTIMDVCRAMLMPMERHMDVNAHPRLKLTYFDTEGLAQASRNTLEYGNNNFEDLRVSMEEFDVLKTSLPYGQVPVLTVDEDTTIAQSKTILRYVSKLSRTYPQNALNAALIDQWTDLHSEFLSLLAMNMYPAKHGLDEACYDAHTHRQFILQTHIPKYLQLLEDELANTGEDEDTWLGGMNAISMADMAWYPTLKWMQNEKFTGFTTNDMDGFPAVCKYLDEMRNQVHGVEMTASQKETELEETEENPESLVCKKDV